MKIAFAGTPEFAQAQLQALLTTSHDIVVVYTQPDRPAGRGQHLQASPVKTLAFDHSLAIEQPITLKTREAQETMAKYQPDVLIVAAYGLILPEHILSLPKFGCINVHASILPRWRGASPIQQAILAGDAFTGITLMQMNRGLDTGDILAQKTCLISIGETAGSLHDKLSALGALFLLEQIDNIISHKGQPQEESAATHAPKITKEQARLDWHKPAILLEREIRAFNPWPIAYTTIQDQLLRIWQAQVVPLCVKANPGTIVEHTPQGIIVATADQGLLLLQGQFPGKKCLSFSDILHSRQALFATGQQFV